MNFTLPRDAVSGDANVYVALMPENLGYAGAINALLRPLLQLPGWHAAWILNPDTEPAPSALFELADYARKHQKGMVGSRIICATHPDDVHVCGLSWRKLTARTVEIDHSTAAYCESGPNNVEAYIDSPDGASIYVSRSLIERIGLMDECYFLYFEDVEWGLRAKKLDELGYAYRSVVWHKGGTTTGSAGTRAGRSKFVVYMEFRNRIIFVRHQHAAWLPWTVLMQAVHMATYLAAGAFTNMLAAGRGVLAGLSGEIGRPDDILQAHTARLAGHSAGGRVLPSGALATVRSSGRGRVRAISNKQAQGG
jgi:GT2 family glycosyltransferase